MKVELCIHSDINNDDESRGVEQSSTRLRAFFWLLQHLHRHTVRSMGCKCVCVCVIVGVCVCIVCVRCGQYTHTRQGERDFER